VNIKELSPALSVSGQISIADLPQLKAQGFKTIICNRPDGEDMGQPTFAEIADAAQAQGLEVKFIPILPGAPMNGEAEQFRLAMDEMAGPILAYCRSGARSTMLWMASK
jgi:sulfide:quinone oxidoreductase